MVFGEITYYRRYVDDVIIIFDQYKINEYSITNSHEQHTQIFGI